jgi:VanZ family protein
MKAKTSIKFEYLSLFLYMLFIFYLSSIPIKLPEIFDFDPTRFTLHVIEYTILGFLLFNARRDFLFSFLFGSIYGLSDEIHQYFVPFRTFSFYDVIADTIGVCLGIFLFKELFIIKGDKFDFQK